MRIRRMLTSVGAIAVAGVMVLVPTVAYAGPIAAIAVLGTSSPNANIPVVGNLQATSTVGFGGNTLNCTSGTTGGVVERGTGGLAPNAAFFLDTLDVTCDNPVPGVPGDLVIDLSGCSIEVVMGASNSVNVGLVDTVDGTAHLTDRTNPLNDCVRVSLAGLACSLEIGGTTAATFDESAQRLTLNATFGSGTLVTANATGLCGAVFPNGTVAALNAVFDIVGALSGTGVGIDFRD